MKILVIALSGIGDALMFTPALKLLKHNLPDSQIDAMVMYGGVKDIYSQLPEISNIFHFNFLKESKIAALKFVKSLRGEYDISINVYPSNRIEYNVINFLIGARKRAAAKYLIGDNKNFGFLNNIRIDESKTVHNVETNIKLVEKITGGKISGELPALQFPLSDQHNKFAEDYLKKNNISTERLIIGLHPGCSTLKNHIKRRWEPEKFAELAKIFITDKKACVLIFGGPEEKDLKSKIKELTGMENCYSVDTSNLAESAAVMKQCNIFITNDSSLMHVASALQLNVIAVIGPTNTNFIHPWKTNHKIVSLNLKCSPCFFYSPKQLNCSRTDKQFKCIRDLQVDMVYNEALNFIDS